MALTTNVGLSILASLTQALDLGTAKFPLSLSKQLTLANGTGASQADLVWSDRRTVAATENLDLAAGALLHPLTGAALTFARVKLIYIAADAANAGNISVGGATNFPFTAAAGDIVFVPPGGILLLTGPGATGFVVTATTADLLTIAGTDVTYDIILVGASA